MENERYWIYRILAGANILDVSRTSQEIAKITIHGGGCFEFDCDEEKLEMFDHVVTGLSHSHHESFYRIGFFVGKEMNPSNELAVRTNNRGIALSIPFAIVEDGLLNDIDDNLDKVITVEWRIQDGIRVKAQNEIYMKARDLKSSNWTEFLGADFLPEENENER